jgi:hypothetical protein
VLGALAPPGAATVYIMTNEWQGSFFDAVRAKYTVFQWRDIPDLRALGASCPISENDLGVVGARSRRAVGRDGGDGGEGGDANMEFAKSLDHASHDTDDLFSPTTTEESEGCDSITLYSVEETLRSLVPPSRRIVTFEDDLDFR